MSSEAEGAALHRLRPDLHNSPQVRRVVAYLRSCGVAVLNRPSDRVAAYLDFLTHQARDGVFTGDPMSVERQIEAHVISADEVPAAYFELQQRLSREQGYGGSAADKRGP